MRRTGIAVTALIMLTGCGGDGAERAQEICAEFDEGVADLSELEVRTMVVGFSGYVTRDDADEDLSETIKHAVYVTNYGTDEEFTHSLTAINDACVRHRD